MTYWYAEYVENGSTYASVGESKTDKPDMIKLIPNIGFQEVNVSTVVEISEDDFNIIHSRMSKFYNL